MDTDRTGPGATGSSDRLKVAIVVPWRFKGDERRLRNFHYVARHLRAMKVGEVVIADDRRTGDAPFNRSAAYNHGREIANDADVFVWHEADMVLDPIQLLEGVDMALAAPGLVVPFDTYAYLSKSDAAEVLNGADPHGFTPEQVMADGRSIGAVGITSAETLNAVGEWDEVFEGWGYDDNAMCLAFAKTSGPTRWVEGTGIHLWHTPGWQAGERFRGGAEIPEKERLATARNAQRLALYKAASTPDQIRTLALGL